MALAIVTIVSTERLRGLLVNALEGGSNYWIEKIDYVLGLGFEFKDFRKGGKAQPKGDYFHWSQLIPTTKGNVLLIKANSESEDFSVPVALNLKALREGATIMATKFPRHWANVISENDDAETGDVLLQCAMFGDIIFG